MFAGRLQDVILSKLWRYGKPSASNATTFEWTRDTNYDGFLGSFSSFFFFASLLFLKLWEKYVGALGMAWSFIWFVSFIQVFSVKVPYHHVSNKGQHGGCWWRNMLEMHVISWSFLVCFCFNYPLIYVQDEWMFGRSSSMLGVNPRRECSFGIGTQMWLRGAGNYAYTLVGLCFDSASGEVRWKTTRGSCFFFQHEALTHLVSPAVPMFLWHRDY